VADLAAFTLLDNKLCGDWEGTSKCPNKESEMYEKYADDRAQSPAAPEALYRAACGVLPSSKSTRRKGNRRNRLTPKRLRQRFAGGFWINIRRVDMPTARSVYFTIWTRRFPVYGNSLE